MGRRFQPPRQSDLIVALDFRFAPYLLACLTKSPIIMAQVIPFVHSHLSAGDCVKLYRAAKVGKVAAQKFCGGEKRMRWLAIGSVALLLAAWGALAQQEQKDQPPDTGLKVGDIVPAYNPIHVAGPDKGTNTCPV